jgi:hypothetical protein
MLEGAQQLELKLRREWYNLQPKDSREFHLFNRLPAELRPYTWRLSLKPQIIEVCPTSEDADDETRLDYPVQPAAPYHLPCRKYPYGYRIYDHLDCFEWIPIKENSYPEVHGWPLTYTPDPPQFYACLESRAATIKLYKPCREDSFAARNGTMINYALNTLYFPQLIEGLEGQCECERNGHIGCIYPDSNAIWRLARSKRAARKIRYLAVTYGSMAHVCGYSPPPTLFPRSNLVRFDIESTMSRY